MQPAAPFLRHAFVGSLVRQRMLEGVDEIRILAGLMDEFPALQFSQAAAKFMFRKPCRGLQQRMGHVLADDSGRLQQSFVS